MLGLLVHNRSPYEPAHTSAPFLPAFLRRAIQALLRKS